MSSLPFAWPAAISGIHTLSIHLSRAFGPGGVSSTPTDYLDNIQFSPSPIPLNLQLTGGMVMLTWTNPAFALQAASSVTAIYTHIPGATSPYANAITGLGRDFRLSSN